MLIAIGSKLSTTNIDIYQEVCRPLIKTRSKSSMCESSKRSRTLQAGRQTDGHKNINILFQNQFKIIGIIAILFSNLSHFLLFLVKEKIYRDNMNIKSPLTVKQ